MSPQTTSPALAGLDHPPAFVDVDGLRTAYRRRGNGPPILFLHGEQLAGRWLPFLEKLAGGHDVIAPDHPGFGDTPMPPFLAGFDDLVLHYDGLLARLGIDSVHLVGHALGGWIAAELAVHYPRRFASLALLAPSGVRLPHVSSIDTFRMDGDEAVTSALNGRDERYAELFAPDRSPEGLIRRFSERATSARLAWNPRYDRKLDWRLRRVAAPALVLRPQEDRIVPVAASVRYAELLPDARMVTVEGDAREPTSHLMHVERPDAVAELVAAHVAAHA